eukprot:jgi/Astpho2/1333/Aster-06203
MMVTRLAWMAARLVSSKRPTRQASAASWRARTALLWKRRPGIVTIQEVIASTGLPPDGMQRLSRVMQKYGYAEGDTLGSEVQLMTRESLQAAARAADLVPPLTFRERDALLVSTGSASDKAPRGGPAQAPGGTNGACGAGVAVPAALAEAERSRNATIYETLILIKQQMGGRLTRWRSRCGRWRMPTIVEAQ